MKRLLKIVLPLIGKSGVLKYVFLGILSGLSSFLFINSVTRVIEMIVAGKFTIISKEYILLFVSIILLFIWARRTLALFSIGLSQRIGWNLRKQILSMLLNANYQQLSERKAKVQSAILADVGALTNASMAVIDFSIAIIMAVSCLTYLASISFILFAITLATAIIGVSVYYYTTKSNMRSLDKARTLENKFQASFNSILNGFKEIYMNPKKGRFIYDRKICTVADESYRNNMSALTGYINNQITGQVLFYILITSVLLVFSIALGISSGNIVSFVFTLLYLLTSIETVMVLLPTLMRAGVASNHLTSLKKDLETAGFRSQVSDRYIFRNEFKHISVRDLKFSYGHEDSSFAIGPISFDLQKNEIVFIYGGNGSGKTTFVHTILGLYFPSAGEIRLNDTVITEDNYPDYRSLFSVVFSDFYLFEEILQDEFNMKKWNFYLRLFELEGKVTIEDKKFSTTDLSTGQRKRLALIIALLEERPILVIDEWAADQDPYFRKKFYTEILPFLKKEGTTIIAITHDDRYYHCADKLYKMDEGKLVEENANLYHSTFISNQTNILVE